MTESLLTFTQMVAWSAIFISGLAIVFNTYARVAVSPIEELRMTVEGSRWRSRFPFFVAAMLGAMWLYASWGR
jgi:hypothetical protein